MTFETRLTPDMTDRHVAAGHWGRETFHDVLSRQAAAHPDRVAIVDRGRRLTCGDLAARGDRVAAHLGALGLGPGDVAPALPIVFPGIATWAARRAAGRRAGLVAVGQGPRPC